MSRQLIRFSLDSCVKHIVAGESTVELVASAESRPRHFRPGREGKSNVTGYFPPEVKKQLRLLAAEHDTTIQNLLAEALNDLFSKHSHVLTPGRYVGEILSQVLFPVDSSYSYTLLYPRFQDDISPGAMYWDLLPQNNRR